MERKISPVKPTSEVTAFVFTWKHSEEVVKRVAEVTGYKDALVHPLLVKGKPSPRTLISLPEKAFKILEQKGLFVSQIGLDHGEQREVKAFQVRESDAPKEGYTHRNLFIPVQQGVNPSSVRHALKERMLQLESRGYVETGTWRVTGLRNEGPTTRLFVQLGDKCNVEEAALIRNFVHNTPVFLEKGNKIYYVQAYWAWEKNPQSAETVAEESTETV